MPIRIQMAKLLSLYLLAISIGKITQSSFTELIWEHKKNFYTRESTPTILATLKNASKFEINQISMRVQYWYPTHIKQRL